MVLEILKLVVGRKETELFKSTCHRGGQKKNSNLRFPVQTEASSEFARELVCVPSHKRGSCSFRAYKSCKLLGSLAEHALKLKSEKRGICLNHTPATEIGKTLNFV